LVKQDKQTVAIFGGSFDPPHLGHQQIVDKVIEDINIDKLLIVPTYLSPFKKSSKASAKQRLEWCHTLFDDKTNVYVEDYEIRQSKSTTTSQSVKNFNAQYNVKYLILGSDNLKTLTKWHEFEWLNDNIIWVIVNRMGHNLQTDILKKWQLLELDVSISSTKIRDSKDLSHIDNKIKKSVQNVLKGRELTIEDRIENIVKILDEKKAEEIEVFNLDDVDYIADRVVIANSLNTKHTQALYEQLKTALNKKDEEFLATDMSDEWIVTDLGDILIHIMIPEYRQRYSLEQFLSELIQKQ